MEYGDGGIVCCNCGAGIEDELAAARREGVIEGLRIALDCFPKPSSTTLWNPKDAILDEIKRLKTEG